MSNKDIKEGITIITPNTLGEELNLDPRVVRRLLRKRFDRKGPVWGWEETDPELEKVRNYLMKQIVVLEEEKAKKEAEREERRRIKKEEAERAIQEAVKAATDNVETFATEAHINPELVKEGNPYENTMEAEA